MHWVNLGAFIIVILGWLAFAVLFLARKTPKREKAARMERSSLIGIGLQGLAYAAVWSLQRTPRFTSIVPMPDLLQVVLALAAVVLSLGSLWLALTAIRTLGREWSYQARLVEGHRLVTGGPYRFVRHPIYAAMLGKLIATGLVLSHWIGLAAGLIIFLIGTGIRVNREEKLLKTQFGAEYDDYARRVPAIIPRLGGTSGA